MRAMTDERSFERGKKYFSNKHVISLIQDRQTIIAKVSGTEDYNIKLWIENSKLAYSCDCPVGMDEYFCKHCVAVGFAWLASEKTTATTAIKPATPKDIRKYLSRQDKNVLVETIM